MGHTAAMQARLRAELAPETYHDLVAGGWWTEVAPESGAGRAWSMVDWASAKRPLLFAFTLSSTVGYGSVGGGGSEARGRTADRRPTIDDRPTSLSVALLAYGSQSPFRLSATIVEGPPQRRRQAPHSSSFTRSCSLGCLCGVAAFGGGCRSAAP